MTCRHVVTDVMMHVLVHAYSRLHPHHGMQMSYIMELMLACTAESSLEC